MMAGAPHQLMLTIRLVLGQKKLPALQVNRYEFIAVKLYDMFQKYVKDTQVRLRKGIIQLMSRQLEQKPGRQADRTICQ